MFLRVIILPVIIVLSCLQLSYGQPDLPKSQGPENNRSVAICDVYGDTVYIDSLHCGTITVKAKSPVTITSFYISYYLRDNMTLKTEHIFDGEISKEVFDKFKQIRPTRVYLQEILGESAEGILILGNRDIYLK